ncbi:MAG: glycosyltransferase family 2 protein, partial [Desulfobacula sp.]|nr:glycosyltransferase family 2 protein [Desulfobacula sp.]
IKKHTDLSKIHVIVIDNDSQDESLDYLRSLSWIELIERKTIPNETPSASHSRALDLALAKVTTPYVLSIHTDTLIKHPGWLDAMISQLEKDSNTAGVGSWKLEQSPSIGKRMWKKIEYGIRIAKYTLLGKKKELSLVQSQKESGYYSISQPDNLDFTKKEYYLRSHCALYRMDLIKKYNLCFNTKDKTAGHEMHNILVKNNHQMIFLSVPFLSKYMVHLNHATMVLHPELGSKKRNIRKGLKRIKKELQLINSDKILKDNSLDG